MYGTLYRHLLLPLFESHIKQRRTLDYWAEAESSQWWSADQLRLLQDHAVADLIAHAFAQCPFYRSRMAERGLSPDAVRSVDDLSKLPLLTRSDILTHREDLRTNDGRRLFSKSTGGSSGQPLHFDLDARSADKRVAMTHRGYGWAGAEPGRKLFYLWGSHVGDVPLWKRWKAALHHRLDRHTMVSCFDFTAERMRDAERILRRKRPDAIIAYTNPLYEWARFLDAEGVTPYAPKSIVVGAEKLHDFQRDLIERVFSAPVFETYGSREFMLIGAECPEHRGLHLSQENLVVEILDDDGLPTPDGEEGNVVITDLYNYGMPFIRYVNGDRAIAGFETCPCGRGLPLLRSVTGRTLDVLTTPDGRTVPGEFFPHLIKEYAAVSRFQVEQRTADEIIIRLVTDEASLAEFRDHLIREVRKCTGDAVGLRIERVDDIPLTNAGKLKVVVRHTTLPAAEVTT